MSNSPSIVVTLFPVRTRSPWYVEEDALTTEKFPFCTNVRVSSKEETRIMNKILLVLFTLLVFKP
jgi:hypothetical protein